MVEPRTGLICGQRLTPGNTPDGKIGAELMANEPKNRQVLADSAYGSGETRAELRRQHTVWPSSPGQPDRHRPLLPGRLHRRPHRPHRHLPRRPHRPRDRGRQRGSSTATARAAPSGRSAPPRSMAGTCKSATTTPNSSKPAGPGETATSPRTTDAGGPWSNAASPGSSPRTPGRLPRSRPEPHLARPPSRSHQPPATHQPRPHPQRELGHSMKRPSGAVKEGTTPWQQATSATGSHPQTPALRSDMPPRTQPTTYASTARPKAPCSADS